MARFLPLVSLLLTLASACSASPPKASPFDALRFNGRTPEVQIDGTWFRPVSIEGVAVDDILAFCQQQWPRQREKRFAEDLVEAMIRMGHDPPRRVRLELVLLDTGEAVEHLGVEMTEAKRRAIWDARNARDNRPDEPEAPVTITRAQAREDLIELERRLDEQFAYAELKGHDWRGALAAWRGRLPERVPVATMARELESFMARFGDGHAGVSSARMPTPARYPTVLFCDSVAGPVAVRPDRSGFVDPDHPVAASINGRPIEDWLRAARPFIPDGSVPFVRTAGLRELRDLDLLAREQGWEIDKPLVLGLASTDGKSSATVEVHWTHERPRRAPWPDHPIGRRLDVVPDSVGYLKLPRMSRELVPELHRTMRSVRDTRGLIVDVRGNGGGDRTLLLALGGYLTGPDEPPRVVNVAQYKQSPRFDRDHLEARFMRRADDPRWTERQRREIDGFARAFEPEWRPVGNFSAWHYLVLDRTGHAEEYFYDRPVVVLCDAGCFSATDIFLGALIDHPRVTLMGTPSGGGSARTQRFTLTHSGIRIRCASMASFRPDGRLYDGRGVEAEIVVRAPPTDLIRGGTDTVLEAAVAHLRAIGAD